MSIRSFLTDLRELFVLPKTAGPVEYLFLIASLTLFSGFILIGVDFAKIGIPLPAPSFFGNIPNLSIKLFVTEIYIAVFGLIALYTLIRQKKLPVPQDFLSQATLFLLLFGMGRLLFDNHSNPIWSIRNAAFVWYLIIPFIILYLPVRNNIIEGTIRLALGSAFMLFAVSLIWYGFFSAPRFIYPKWSASFGIYAPLALGLLLPRTSGRTARIILLLIGFAFGACIWSSFQRTSLVGCLFIGVLCFFFDLKNKKRYFQRVSVILAGLLFGFLYWPAKNQTVEFFRNTDFNYLAKYVTTQSMIYFTKDGTEKEKLTRESETFKRMSGLVSKQPTANNYYDARTWQEIASYGINPLSKGIATSEGLELFRWQMWRDAYRIFLEHPLFGIGFHDFVVYKRILSQAAFIFNSPQPNKAPISGPHNSYLNAMARIGILGVLFLVIHIWAASRLLLNGYYGAFFITFSHSLYALFNVALEGPVRSLGLLVALGLALKIGPGKSVFEFFRERDILRFSSNRVFFIENALSLSLSRLKFIGIFLFFVACAGSAFYYFNEKNMVQAASLAFANIQNDSSLPNKAKISALEELRSSARGPYKYFIEMAIGSYYMKQQDYENASLAFAKAVRVSKNGKQEAFALQSLGVAFEKQELRDFSFMAHRINMLFIEQEPWAASLSLYAMARLLERTKPMSMKPVPEEWTKYSLIQDFKNRFSASPLQSYFPGIIRYF